MKTMENSPNRWYKKYRIIHKPSVGYRAQVKYIFIPFWQNCYGLIYSKDTLEEAEEVVWRHSPSTVKIWDNK